MILNMRMITRRFSSQINQHRIGVIGIGAMGKGIALNLLKNKAPLTIYDTNDDNINSFMKMANDSNHIKIASSISDLAKTSDVICLSLPSEAITENVLFGSNGITSINMSNDNNKNKIVLDHGTFSRSFVLKNHHRAKENGIMYIDAPVSGGPQGASLGTLTIMLGGDDDTISIITPILKLYSKKIVHFGAIGNGMGAKLINQALVSIHAQAASEAIVLAETMGLGLETPKLLDMLKESWGQSKILELAFQDYINAQKNGWDTLDSSPAPLRNLVKDMACVQKEFISNDDKNLCPTINAATNAIHKACTLSGLENSAFVSLVDLMKSRDERKRF